MGLIYHIAYLADWEQAQRDGDYRVSTRGRTLAQQGYIHCGRAHQVAPVANAIYRDEPHLVVLVIDEARVGPEVKYDEVPGAGERFPHIYGPLNLDAVVGTAALTRSAEGHYSFEPS